MPFGLTNTLTPFMTLMDNNLRLYLGRFVIVFLDNILTYNDIPKEHIQYLKMVFELFREHKSFSKESKFEFFKVSIHYLEHIISSKGIAKGMTKVNAIRHCPSPKNLKELQILLGLVGFYRKYVRQYV